MSLLCMTSVNLFEDIKLPIGYIMVRQANINNTAKVRL